MCQAWELHLYPNCLSPSDFIDPQTNTTILHLVRPLAPNTPWSFPLYTLANRSTQHKLCDGLISQTTVDTPYGGKLWLLLSSVQFF